MGRIVTATSKNSLFADNYRFYHTNITLAVLIGLMK